MINVDFEKRVGEGSFSLSRKRSWCTNRCNAASLSCKVMNDHWGLSKLGRKYIIVDFDAPDCRLEKDCINHHLCTCTIMELSLNLLKRMKFGLEARVDLVNGSEACAHLEAVHSLCDTLAELYGTCHWQMLKQGGCGGCGGDAFIQPVRVRLL